jgi:hypothetical protein
MSDGPASAPLDDTPTEWDLAPGGAPPLVAPPPPPAARSRDWRRIALIAVGVVAVLALVAGIAYAASKRLASPNATALSTAQNYCAAVKAQNYGKAFTYLAPIVQAAITPGAYPAAAQAEDTVRGPLTGCTLGQVTLSNNGKTATLPALLARKQAGSQSYTWQLAQASDGTWQFSQPPDDAIVPFALMTRYCADVQANNLDTAYQLFSINEQQTVGTLDNFKTDMGQTEQYTGALTGCHVQSLHLSSDKTLQYIGLAFDFANYKNVPANMAILIATSQVNDVSIKVEGIDVTFPIPVSEIQQILSGLGLSSHSGT